ncbi:hypothetical protein [Caballeronia sp. LZ035]|nr:hypothetical protein [Caballeronia sp. LZ035]MDR5757512.1 hypothetical protein [Caballeronia sp. LZ035]
MNSVRRYDAAGPDWPWRSRLLRFARLFCTTRRFSGATAFRDS